MEARRQGRRARAGFPVIVLCFVFVGFYKLLFPDHEQGLHVQKNMRGMQCSAGVLVAPGRLMYRDAKQSRGQ